MHFFGDGYWRVVFVELKQEIFLIEEAFIGWRGLALLNLVLLACLLGCHHVVVSLDFVGILVVVFLLRCL